MCVSDRQCSREGRVGDVLRNKLRWIQISFFPLPKVKQEVFFCSLSKRSNRRVSYIHTCVQVTYHAAALAPQQTDNIHQFPWSQTSSHFFWTPLVWIPFLHTVLDRTVHLPKGKYDANLICPITFRRSKRVSFRFVWHHRGLKGRAAGCMRWGRSYRRCIDIRCGLKNCNMLFRRVRVSYFFFNARFFTSDKRELDRRLIYECPCDERLKLRNLHASDTLGCVGDWNT